MPRNKYNSILVVCALLYVRFLQGICQPDPGQAIRISAEGGLCASKFAGVNAKILLSSFSIASE